MVVVWLGQLVIGPFRFYAPCDQNIRWILPTKSFCEEPKDVRAE